MKTLAATAILLCGALMSALPAQAHNGHQSIDLLSPDPLAGDYTMTVHVDGVTLTDDFADPDDDSGHLLYGLNQAPCNGSCSNGQPYETANETFTFYDLKVGDIIVAVVVHGNGTDFEPPVFIVRAVRNVNQQGDAVRLAINGTAPHPGVPNPGQYTMDVVPIGVELVQPGIAEDTRGEGHLLYTLNGQACVDPCSTEPAETTSTTFTFHDLQVGDVVGVELLNNHGSPFYPAVKRLQAVAAPSLQVVTSGPHEGASYKMTVHVSAFTLVAAAKAGPNNAGAGHIHYLVKPKDAADFKPASGDSDTVDTSFTFRDLHEGDTVAAELVANDHGHLATQVLRSQIVGPAEEKDPLAPGVGPILVLVLLGAAFVARSRRA
ncbi:MAG: hypothetical protein V4510_00450 [bacterium]